MPDCILIYRLRFRSGLRCGSLAGDVNRQQDFVPGSTLLGGVACCAARLFGAAAVEGLVRGIRISSLLWLKDGKAYIPRPALGGSRPDSEDRKRLKEWSWIPLEDLAGFVRKGRLPDEDPPLLFTEEGLTSASLDRATFAAVPFSRKRTVPAEGAEGLVVAVVPQEYKSVFEGGIRLLGDTGIGGERSTGWGHFTTVPLEGPEAGAIEKGLRGESDLYVTLGAFLPSPGEIASLEGGTGKDPSSCWNIWRLRGYAGDSSDILKPTVTCLAHGSVFPFRPEGRVEDITPEGAPNPVLFNGRPPSLAIPA